jgi:hypothetical protein
MLEDMYTMFTIAIVVLGAYLGITLLFVLGLAAAAARLTPVHNTVELPVQGTAESESSLEKSLSKLREIRAHVWCCRHKERARSLRIVRIR